MKYAREWTMLRGEEPEGDFMAAFETLYTREERRRINKLMRIMLFSNYTMNFIHDRHRRRTSAQDGRVEKGSPERLL